MKASFSLGQGSLKRRQSSNQIFKSSLKFKQSSQIIFRIKKNAVWAFFAELTRFQATELML